MEVTLLCFSLFTHGERTPSTHYTLTLFCGMFEYIHVWGQARAHTHIWICRKNWNESVNLIFKVYLFRINEHQLIQSSETHQWNNQNMPWAWGALIPDTSLPEQPNFLAWHQRFLGPHCEICFISPSWHLIFWDGSHYFWTNGVPLDLGIVSTFLKDSM
jgi:hypothetical protein